MSERQKLAQQQRRAEHAKERQPRIDKMIALRQAGSTLEQIGEAFGLTRERVRQLIRSMPRPPQPPKPLEPRQRKPEQLRKHLHRVMRQWLWNAGYRRCAFCQIWSCDVTQTGRCCRECNRRRSRAYVATPHGREVQRRWQKANPEKMRQYAQRWREAHPRYQAERMEWLNASGKTKEYAMRRARQRELLAKENEPGVNDLLNAFKGIVKRRMNHGA